VRALAPDHGGLKSAFGRHDSFPAKHTQRARGKEVVAAKPLASAHRCFRRNEVVKPARMQASNRRLRSRAAPSISEKPRIRRDKPAGRQTAVRTLILNPLSTACAQVVQNHPYRFATPRTDVASRERTLSCSAISRAQMCRLDARRTSVALWITIERQTTIHHSSS